MCTASPSSVGNCKFIKYTIEACVNCSCIKHVFRLIVITPHEHIRYTNAFLSTTNLCVIHYDFPIVPYNIITKQVRSLSVREPNQIHEF